MKVLVGEFVTESNANIPTICTIKQYDIGLGEDCIQKMGIREVFERNDVTLIPSIYANAGAAGVVEKSAFTYIEHMFIDTLKKNLHEIDGIFLMLHGASEVEALGSGDHHILKELRKLAGPYLPIAIVCDPHGNLSINRYMDELEKDDRILSCSWHVGYIRHDCDVAGCGIIVVPYSEQDLPYAQEAADRLAAYVWEKRHEFHYTGLTASPSKALQMALDFQDKPVFITDSGDNVTSGATGWNTGILRQVLQTETTKKFLFATICDPAAYQTLSACKTGEELSFTLGVGFDELSSAVELDAVVKSSGKLTGFMMHDHTSVFGHCVNVHVKGTSIDIMVADTGWAVCELHQFVSAGIDVDAYDVIVVKQGCIFPDFKAKGKLCVMSLTEGATLQDTARLPFKRIMRPMFPIDDI